MGYCGPMGFSIKIPAHQVGGQEKLWSIRGYGLSEVWVMRSSTVISSRHYRIAGTPGDTYSLDETDIDNADFLLACSSSAASLNVGCAKIMKIQAAALRPSGLLPLIFSQ